MAAVTELPQFRIPYAAKNSLLGWAVTENNIEWVEKALKMGANPNSPYDTFIESFTKPSPFQMTLKQSNQAMTSLLLKYGANPYGESNRHIRVLLKKKDNLLGYAKKHCHADFYKFLTEEIARHQSRQAAIALEGSKFYELDIPNPLHHLTASFLAGQETTELSRQLPDQLTEEQEIRKILWARFCEETAQSSSNSWWIHTSNPDKVAALRHYSTYEPDTTSIRDFIGIAAQRRRHGTGETFCLETVCRLLKRSEYSFIRAELSINEAQVTPDNLRMIARYGCIKSDKASIRMAKECFSSTKVCQGNYSNANELFQAITSTSSPRLMFHEHHNTLEEHEHTTAPEARSLALEYT
ncbi:hypothetical protein AVI50_06330 [Piscirickettsia salmonis]|nr:hypothetical protein AVI50_06330 [Piscirickettsia salmonis]